MISPLRIDQFYIDENMKKMVPHFWNLHLYPFIIYSWVDSECRRTREPCGWQARLGIQPKRH